MSVSKVNFIGAGVIKGATSWIYKCLLEHPEICGYKEKELRFFDDDEKFKKGKDYYLSFFGECDDSKIVGEYSPAYLHNGETAKRIHSLFPDVKIIICLRNPVERSISHMLHLKSKKRVPLEASLKEAINLREDIVSYSKYSKHLKKYLEVFPKENILVLIQDDIKIDPVLFLEKIYNFLGVDDTFISKGVNVKYHSTSSKFSKTYKMVNKIYLRLRKSPLGRSIIKILSFVGLNSYTLYRIVGKFGKGKDKEINIADKKYLEEYFRGDILELERCLGINLEKWKK